MGEEINLVALEQSKADKMMELFIKYYIHVKDRQKAELAFNIAYQ